MRHVLILIALSLTTLQAEPPPNILIILADDLGWGDPQCYQADSKIPTPHMDRLAAEGMRFTDAHTPSSVCTPTRYTLLTGRYAWRTRLKDGVLDGFDPPLIEPEEDTLATMLARQGYRTACVGKWHLGMTWQTTDGGAMPQREGGFRQGKEVDYTQPTQGGPLDTGFHSWFGISASLDMSPYCYLEGRKVTVLPTVETPENRDGMFMNQVPGMQAPGFKLVDVLPRLAEEAVKVIESHQGREEPLFLYMPLTSPHLPAVPTKDSEGASGAGIYGDFVVDTDKALGRVLQALDDTGMAENTLVLLTSDNGGLWHWWDFEAADDGGKIPLSKRGAYVKDLGHQSNADWRGTKADVFEGGHRVPFLVRWPGVIEPGQVCEALVELTDMAATIEEITGGELKGESGCDSFSMLPLLRGEADAARPFAVHHSVRGLFAIRKGDWKLIEGRGSGGFTQPRFIEVKAGDPEGQLYHLGEDPQERVNRYWEESETVEELLRLLEDIQASSAVRVSGGKK